MCLIDPLTVFLSLASKVMFFFGMLREMVSEGEFGLSCRDWN